MPECYVFDYIDEDDVYLEGDEYEDSTNLEYEEEDDE